ncbi:hypothetical protein Tco_0920105 [Tanacetum coccineum]
MEIARGWTKAKLQEGRLMEPTKSNGKEQTKAVKKGEVRHTTDECMHLKRQIEEMLKEGKLSHLIKELNQREEDGTEGPMIIEAEMGGHFVHRMYVDGGSSSEILYEYCFNRFCPEVRSQMVLATTPLVGFSGEIIWPLGQISLLVKIGDKEHSTFAWMNFMVVRSPSLYNEIIGRPGVRRIQAVPSTAHEMLKFLVTSRMVTLQSSRIIPLECIMVLGPVTQQPLIDQVAKGNIKVEIHPEHNLDIFTWELADMTKDLRHIAEHRLNIHEGCLPVRQKKRRQPPERNKAIHEEVEKLVSAGIMK